MNRRLDGDAEWLGKVLAAVPAVVLVVDCEGTILYINHVEEGYDREAILGMQADSIMPPESKATFWSTLDAVRRTGVPEEFESEAISPTGESQWYRSRMIPIQDNGKFSGAMIMATNITELRAAEDQVERLRRLLPICSWCNKIQSEDGAWLTLEAHLEKERGTGVSHGICPDCYREQLGSDHGNKGRKGRVT